MQRRIRFAILAGVTALAASGSVLAADTAASNAAKAKAEKGNRAAPATRVYDDRDAAAGRWYPRDPDRLKFGSRIWWTEMENAGRLSRPENH